MVCVREKNLLSVMKPIQSWKFRGGILSVDDHLSSLLLVFQARVSSVHLVR